MVDFQTELLLGKDHVCSVMSEAHLADLLPLDVPRLVERQVIAIVLLLSGLLVRGSCTSARFLLVIDSRLVEVSHALRSHPAV